MQRTIGFLGATDSTIWGKYVTAVEKVLDQLGPPSTGDVVKVSYLWAYGNPTLYGPLAQQLVDRGAEAIITSGTQCVNSAYNQIGSTIPIFFASAGGPINTSTTSPNTVIGTLNQQTDQGHANTRFQWLRSVLPTGTPTVAVLGDFHVANVSAEWGLIRPNSGGNGAGQSNQINVTQIDIHGMTPQQIENTVTSQAAQVDLLYVCTDPMVTYNQDSIIRPAKAGRLRTMFGFREYVENGGLLSFGPNFTLMFARAAKNAHAFLGGTPLAQLTGVTNPSYELVINTLTEAAIQKPIPPSVRNHAELWPFP